MKFNFSSYSQVALGFLQCSSILASSVVYTYNGKSADSTTVLQSLDSAKQFEYLLFDKLQVDDDLSLSDEDAKQIENVRGLEEYLENDSNGHLVIMLNDDKTHGKSHLEKLFEEYSIKPLLKIHGLHQSEHIMENGDALFDALLKQNNDLKVNTKNNNMKVLSNLQEPSKSVAFSGFNSYNSESLNLNEKALIQLGFLIEKIFTSGSIIIDENDKFYSMIKIKLDYSKFASPNAFVIQKNLIELIQRAFDYGIDSTIIVDGTPKVRKPSQHHPRRASLSKRSSILSKQTSFDSEEECIFSTNNCNTHGLCSKNSLSQKWSCLCSSTFNKTSQSTTHWSGPSCQKIDISTEFNLLFWSSLIMLLTVVGAIMMIFKMDNEPLPGILSAATNANFKN